MREKARHELWPCSPDFFGGELEQWWKRPAYCGSEKRGKKRMATRKGGRVTRREPLSWVAQFVEKGVSAGLERAQTLERSVPQELGHQVNRLRRGAVTEHLCPRMGLDLGKFEVRVVGVHGVYFFTSRSANDLDNFNELVNVGLTRKDRSAKQHFSKHATKRPHINRWGIIGRSKYQLGGSIIAAADVGYVRLAFDKLLGAAKT